MLGDFIGKCIKVENFPQMKVIKWEMRPKNKAYEPFTFKYQLFKITKKSTVFLWKIHFRSYESYQKYKEDKQNVDKIWKEYTSNINKLLNSSSLILFQFEAGVISASMENIWSLLTDLSQLKKIAPLIPLMDLITTWLLLLEQFLQFHVIMEGNFYMLKRSDMITDHIGING